MGGTGAQRAGQACAVAAVGVPGVLLTHLLTTGAPATVPAAVGVALAVLLAGASRLVGGAPALAALTGFGQLAGHTVLALYSPATSGPPACIPAVGRGASLGLQFAVLRADAACPVGTLAPGPTASVALTAVGIAVAILAGNALIAVLGGLLLRAAVRATVVTELITEVLARLPAAIRALLLGVRAPVRPMPRSLPARCAAVPVPGPQWRPGTVLLRGPPRRRAVTA